MLEKHDALLEDGFPLPKYDLNEHLKLMQDCHIEWSLLSLSTPQPYFEDVNEVKQMCRHLNEQMTKIKKEDP